MSDMPVSCLAEVSQCLAPTDCAYLERNTHVTLCYIMLGPMLHNVMLHYVTLCWGLCYITLRYIMLHYVRAYVTLHYDVLIQQECNCSVTLRYAVLQCNYCSLVLYTVLFTYCIAVSLSTFLFFSKSVLLPAMHSSMLSPNILRSSRTQFLTCQGVSY